MKYAVKTKKIIFIAGACLLAAALSVTLLLHSLFKPNESAELSIRMPEGRALRIAQFADLHFGDGVSNYHNTKEERTRAYMAYVVENGKPDLIVCTGDQVMSSGVTGMKEFVAMMDSYRTPWVFVWGNHDAEGTAFGYSKREVSAYLAGADSQYLLYAEGYTEEGKENRYGNFSVLVLDSEGKRAVGALMFLDSGTYSYEDEAYQEITAGQVEWYKQEVDRLQEIYKTGKNAEGVIPTVVFAHMPLPDFSVACRKAQAGDGAEFVINEGGFWGGNADAPRSPLFEAMAEKGSAKAYFVGHYHVARYQVRMDGILLGFGPQTGFSHTGSDGARSTYVYSIAEDFSITTENFAEQVGG